MRLLLVLLVLTVVLLLLLMLLRWRHWRLHLRVAQAHRHPNSRSPCVVWRYPLHAHRVLAVLLLLMSLVHHATWS